MPGTGTDAGTGLMAVNAGSAVPSRRLSQCVSMLINAGQTYTINSSYAFRLGLISLRINILFFSTSVQSLLFLILEYFESFDLFSCLYYSNSQQVLQCCPGVSTSTCPGVKWTDTRTASAASSAVLAFVLARHALDRPKQL